MIWQSIFWLTITISTAHSTIQIIDTKISKTMDDQEFLEDGMNALKLEKNNEPGFATKTTLIE